MSELIFTTPPDSTDSPMLHLQRQTVSLEQLAPEPVRARFFSDKGGVITEYAIEEGERGTGYVVGDIVSASLGFTVADFTVDEVDEDRGIITVSLIGSGGGGYFIGESPLGGGSGSNAILIISSATPQSNEIVVGNCRNFLVVVDYFGVEMSIEGCVYLPNEVEEKWVVVDKRTHTESTPIQFTGGFSKIRLTYEVMAVADAAGYLTAF